MFMPLFIFVTNGSNVTDHNASFLMGDSDFDGTIDFSSTYTSSNAGIQGRVDDGIIFACGGICNESNCTIEEFHSGVTNAETESSRGTNDDSVAATATTARIVDATCAGLASP